MSNRHKIYILLYCLSLPRLGAAYAGGVFGKTALLFEGIMNLNDKKYAMVLNVLRRELRAFRMSGLTALRRDFRKYEIGKTWDDCPLSYRLGDFSLVAQDSKGRNVNTFTEAWDLDKISRAAVLREVRAEIATRKALALAKEKAKTYSNKGASEQKSDTILVYTGPAPVAAPALNVPAAEAVATPDQASTPANP